MTFSMSTSAMQSPPSSGQYLPAPYMPDSAVVTSDNSLRFAGSLGAGLEVLSFSSLSARAVEGDSSWSSYCNESCTVRECQAAYFSCMRADKIAVS
jgi:hypothetical protein